MKKIFVIVVLIIIAVSLGLGFIVGKRAAIGNPPLPGGVACTMEAKICPDGSAVGRSGPKCEFEPCPSQ
jgi:hypothetical protein